MNNIFYVYAYIRANKSETASAGTPYYIGKGKNRRAYAKHGKALAPPKHRIIILEKNLTEIGALAIERRMISWYGRKDLGTGILINLTDGGEGLSGYKLSEQHKAAISSANMGRCKSAETIQKISVANKGQTRSDEVKEKLSKSAFNKPPPTAETNKKISESNKGRVVSLDTRSKIGKASKGRVHTQETKDKLSESHKGNIPWNKNMIGLQTAWNKGIITGPQSPDTISKKVAARKGVPWSASRRAAQNKDKNI